MSRRKGRIGRYEAENKNNKERRSRKKKICNGESRKRRNTEKPRARSELANSMELSAS
jgi:hypothetical protein